MNYELKLRLKSMALITGVVLFFSLLIYAAVKNIVPDRAEPVPEIKDSLADGFFNRLNCPETGKKSIVVYNKAGQEIAHYNDTMTADDYKLYNHSKLLNNEETIRGDSNISVSDNGAGQ